MCVCVCVSTAPGVCVLGRVKCREHISLLVILCIIVYVTNKAHLICLWPCVSHKASVELDAYYVASLSETIQLYILQNIDRERSIKLCFPRQYEHLLITDTDCGVPDASSVI